MLVIPSAKLEGVYLKLNANVRQRWVAYRLSNLPAHIILFLWAAYQ